MYFVGIDLGKRRDYTGISINERKIIYDKEYRVGNRLPDIIEVKYYTKYLYRPPLGTSYQKIITFTKTLLNHPKIKNDYALVIDATGVGEAVAEMFVSAELNPVWIKITSGNKYNPTDEGYNVPKLEIISVLQVLLQNARYKVSKKLQLASHFLKELQNFKYKMSDSGIMTMEADKETIHDDLVLSVGIAMWYAETIAKPVNQNITNIEYNPYDFI